MKEEEDLAAAHAEITGVGGTLGFLLAPLLTFVVGVLRQNENKQHKGNNVI